MSFALQFRSTDLSDLAVGGGGLVAGQGSVSCYLTDLVPFAFSAFKPLTPVVIKVTWSGEVELIARRLYLASDVNSM